MQVLPKQLIRQQAILKALGFYSGVLDGIWGPESIAAKKSFENKPDLFRPARQTNGLPFGDSDPLPTGIYYVPSVLDGKLLQATALEKNKEIVEEEKQAVNKLMLEASPAVVPDSKPQPIKIENLSTLVDSKKVEEKNKSK